VFQQDEKIFICEIRYVRFDFILGELSLVILEMKFFCLILCMSRESISRLNVVCLAVTYEYS